MVTYEGLFEFVVMIVAIVTLVINATKKQPPSGKVYGYFLVDKSV